MVDRKLVILGLFIFIGGLGNALPVWAYNDSTTHRAITQEAIKLFEFYNPNQTFLGFFNSKQIYSIKGFDSVRKAQNYAKKYGYTIFEKLPAGVKDFEYWD